jgi:glycosyltransferase involved in cell wall biosynthesis
VLKVASVPASHIYVRNLADPRGGDRVLRLPDPVPANGQKVPGGWWPPLMLEPGWVTDNHDRFDVFHVHFGFDAIAPDQLREVVDELERHRKPLIYTVHDLRNPHHGEPTAHDKQQDVLVGAAHALITLTPGAARAIFGRWGRTAMVLPHPHVLDQARIQRPRSKQTSFVVAVHAKSVRANMDPLPVMDTLIAVIEALPNTVLQLDIHDEVFDHGSYWYAPELGARLREYGRYDHVEARVHPYFTDDELWDYLSSVSVSVLPYRFGTHSGWLEACFDLGTAAVVPTCGFYSEQRPCEVFGFTEDSFDPDSLRHAVRTQYDRWAAGLEAPRARWAERHTERIGIARAHREIYQAALR